MVKRIFTLVCAIVVISFSAIAQTANSSVRSSMQSMAERLDEKDGVECMVCVKGNGLEMMKLMMRKEMGKDFIKGVDMIVIINYSEAPSAKVTEIRNEIENIAKIELTQQELPDDIKEGKYMRTYFREGDDGKSIHDMIIIAEDESEKESSKIVMYFGGVMRDEPKTMK